MYHTHITDPYSPLYMYDRIDEKLMAQGHSYSVCDRNFACPHNKKFKRRKTIETMDDWIEIYKSSKRSNPFIMHKMEQDEIYNWEGYLKQFYIKTRLDSNGMKPLLQGSHWRNYGWGWACYLND